MALAPDPSQPIARRALLWAHLAMVLQTTLIGPGYSFTRQAAVVFEPLTLLWLRLTITAVLMGTWLLASGQWRTLTRLERPLLRRLIIVTLAGITANQLFFMLGLRYTTPASSALLYALSPVAVLILAVWVFRTERFQYRKLGGLALCLVGVVLVFTGTGKEFAGDRLLGNAITLCGVFAFAFYMVYSRPLFRVMDSFTVTAWTMVLGALVFFPAGPFLLPETDWGAITGEAWFGLTYLILNNSILSYALILYALTRLEATQVTPYMNMQPVSATLFSVLYLGEQLTGLFVLGGLLTLGGLFWMNRK